MTFPKVILGICLIFVALPVVISASHRTPVIGGAKAEIDRVPTSVLVKRVEELSRQLREGIDHNNRIYAVQNSEGSQWNANSQWNSNSQWTRNANSNSNSNSNSNANANSNSNSNSNSNTNGQWGANQFGTNGENGHWGANSLWETDTNSGGKNVKALNTTRVGEQGPRPMKYFDLHRNYKDHSHDGRTCTSWRIDSWIFTAPEHKVEEISETPFLIGIGPPRTASSTTFAVLASNPKMCYWREPYNDGSFAETHDLLKHFDDIESELLRHFAPKECCEGNVMKDPLFSTSMVAPLKLGELFSTNPNAKFVLTIRDPVDAMESLLDFKRRPENSNGQVNFYLSNGDAWVTEVLKRTDKMKACREEMDKNGEDYKTDIEAAKKYDEFCLTHFSLGYYDYKATFQRYAEKFGADKIYCQFITDLKAGKASKVRRDQFDFIGLHNLDENDVVGKYTAHSRQIHLTDSERILLKNKYNETIGEPYDEAALRSMCTHSS